MSGTRCPNCGNSLPDVTSSCPCGFSYVEGEMEVPAPGIVRTVAPSAKDRVTPASQATKAPAEPRTKKKPAENKRERASDGAVARPNEALIMGCPSCGARISKRAQECPKCGSTPYDHCQVCAARILANTAPCSECGDPEPFETPAA